MYVPRGVPSSGSQGENRSCRKLGTNISNNLLKITIPEDDKGMKDDPKIKKKTAKSYTKGELNKLIEQIEKKTKEKPFQ